MTALSTEIYLFFLRMRQVLLDDPFPRAAAPGRIPPIRPGKRRMLFFLNGIAALLLGGAAAQASDSCGDMSHYTSAEQRYTSGLLFRVERRGAPVSYVFGTVHLARREVARAAGAAFLTLSKVQAAGFELAESEEEIAALGGRAMTYPEGAAPHSLRRQLGTERFARLIELIKGTPVDQRKLERLRPWAIAILIELLGEPPGNVLDEKIRQAAVAMGKPVFGLEKPEDQIDVFSSMPEMMQIRMLKEAIDDHAKLALLKQSMLDAYLLRDMKKIEALEDSALAASDDPGLDAFLKDHLINERNRAMEQRLLPRLRKESVMVSVGAMHLMGRSGILHLLEQDGYCITPVP
jgi:uncharacterized protein YbaP (TraB family)